MKHLSFLIFLITALTGNPSEASPLDSTFTIKDSKITLYTNIYIYGEAATNQVAADIENTILSVWEKRSDGTPWTFLDPKTNRTYTVHFRVKVRVYEGKEKIKPEGIYETLNPLNRSNYIQMTNKEFRSQVQGGDEGTWQLDSDHTYAHEFGHLLGLIDRYKDKNINGEVYSIPDLGWEKNLMGNSSAGVVEQRNIDTIATLALVQYKKFLSLNRLLKLKSESDAFHGWINIDTAAY